MGTRGLWILLLFVSVTLWSQSGNVNWNKINTIEKAMGVVTNLKLQLESGELTKREIIEALEKYRQAAEAQIEYYKNDYSVLDSERLKWYKIFAIISKEENEYLVNTLSVFVNYLKDLEEQDQTTADKLSKIEEELSGFTVSLSESLKAIKASYQSIETGFSEYNEIIATQRNLIQDLLKDCVDSSSKSTVVIGPGFTNGLNNPSVDISVGYLQHLGIFTMGGIIDFGVKSNLEMPINIGARLLLGLSFY